VGISITVDTFHLQRLDSDNLIVINTLAEQCLSKPLNGECCAQKNSMFSNEQNSYANYCLVWCFIM
jgi:hypothetical protein